MGRTPAGPASVARRGHGAGGHARTASHVDQPRPGYFDDATGRAITPGTRRCNRGTGTPLWAGCGRRDPQQPGVSSTRQRRRTNTSHRRSIAERIGSDRNDYGTEFGPTNVTIHAVAIAVELGDAGQALDLAQEVDASQLSPERQARYLIDLSQAQAMRRQIGEALHSLQEAERLTPEQTRTHRIARAVTRDLIQLSGLHPTPELRELAERFGVLP